MLTAIARALAVFTNAHKFYHLTTKTKIKQETGNSLKVVEKN